MSLLLLLLQVHLCLPAAAASPRAVCGAVLVSSGHPVRYQRQGRHSIPADLRDQSARHVCRMMMVMHDDDDGDA